MAKVTAQGDREGERRFETLMEAYDIAATLSVTYRQPDTDRTITGLFKVAAVGTDGVVSRLPVVLEPLNDNGMYHTLRVRDIVLIDTDPAWAVA